MQDKASNDQRNAEPDRRTREGENQEQRERAGQARKLVAAKACLQADANQEGDGNSQHHHVVHEQIWGCEQRGGRDMILAGFQSPRGIEDNIAAARRTLRGDGITEYPRSQRSVTG